MSLNTIRDLQESRGKKIAEMRTINEKAQTEKRDLSGEERKQFDALDGEVRTLNARLSDAEKLAEFERLEARGDDVNGNAVARHSLKDYSLAKALMESRSSGLTGLEAEWHQELASGRAEVRGVMVPTEIILGGETRALTTTTPGAGPGSNLISTDLASMTDRRRAALKIESMGATVMRGLTGNMDLPRLNSYRLQGQTEPELSFPRVRYGTTQKAE